MQNLDFAQNPMQNLDSAQNPTHAMRACADDSECLAPQAAAKASPSVLKAPVKLSDEISIIPTKKVDKKVRLMLVMMLILMFGGVRFCPTCRIQ